MTGALSLILRLDQTLKKTILYSLNIKFKVSINIITRTSERCILLKIYVMHKDSLMMIIYDLLINITSSALPMSMPRIAICFYVQNRMYVQYAMVVYRSHDTARSLAHGVFISRSTGNPDPLAKSRPTGKIQIHWLGDKVVHIVTRNIKK